MGENDNIFKYLASFLASNKHSAKESYGSNYSICSCCLYHCFTTQPRATVLAVISTGLPTLSSLDFTVASESPSQAGRRPHLFGLGHLPGLPVASPRCFLLLCHGWASFIPENRCLEGPSGLALQTETCRPGRVAGQGRAAEVTPTGMAVVILHSCLWVGSRLAANRPSPSEHPLRVVHARDWPILRQLLLCPVSMTKGRDPMVPGHLGMRTSG